VDVRNALVGVLFTAGALVMADWLLPGLRLDPWWYALSVALALAVADLLVRPALRLLAVGTGAVPAVAAGVLVQFVLVQSALSLAGSVTSLAATGTALVLIATARAVVRWLRGARDASYVVAELGGPAPRKLLAPTNVRPVLGEDVLAPAVVLVQVDGLSFPVLRQGVESGRLPTLSRWLRSRTHEVVPWWARLPSSTPAGQAGLLHDTSSGIPAFRWYEKEARRLVVANRPIDAAAIESRISDGRGLLATGGVSVSNMFTGDAPTNRVVVSRAPRGAGSGSGPEYLRVFGSSLLVAHVALVTLREMIKELRESRRQRLRHVEPRVRRGAAWAVVRGLTNALLRDVDLALVAQHMMRGAPLVYVTFVDYDEMAHHAGVARPESLAVLADIDRVLAALERVAAHAPRRYRFVVLSDHGQSQGATFRQLSGHSLEDAVRAHAGLERSGGHQGDDDLVVMASGNLGLVWFPRLLGRVRLETLRNKFPALVPGLLGEPGVAFVVADSSRGPVVIGAHGVHVLATDGGTDVVEGSDPLVPFGPRAARDLARVAVMRAFPDLLVHSTVDQGTGDVHAFEELVGSHGGLGGWQNLAVLVHPADWRVDDDLLDRSVPGEALLYGAESVHRQLVRWVEREGLR
jgi:uncharacterized membrane protein YvlD (DUF360 family)